MVKNVKKWSALMLCGLVMTLLCACGNVGKDIENGTSSVVSDVESIGGEVMDKVDLDKNASQTKLESILDDINVNYHRAVAGQTINAMEREIALMDWASETKMSDEEIRTTTENWMNDNLTGSGNENTRDQFAKKMEDIDGVYRSQLLSEEKVEELSSNIDIKATSTHYPWNSEVINRPLDTLLETVKA